jgi:hypothetical protein
MSILTRVAPASSPIEPPRRTRNMAQNNGFSLQQHSVGVAVDWIVMASGPAFDISPLFDGDCRGMFRSQKLNTRVLLGKILLCDPRLCILHLSSYVS